MAAPDNISPAASTSPAIAFTNEDWNGIQPILNKWERRARESQYAHYEAAKALNSANYRLGIPVAILSTLVGTTIYATLQKEVGVRLQIAVGSVSVLTAILAGLQTFLRYGERAEKHRATGASYAEVRRTIESVRSRPLRIRPPLAEFISELEKRLNDLSRNAPNVSDRIFARGLRQIEISSQRHGSVAGALSAPATVLAAAAAPDQASDPYI